MRLTQQKIDGYVLIHDGQRCPSCGSEALEGDEVVIEYAQAFQNVKCSQCLEEWRDVYELAGLQGSLGIWYATGKGPSYD